MLSVCSPQCGGKRDKIKGREMGKDAARGCRTLLRDRKKGTHGLLEIKQVVFFSFCVNVIVLGQIQGRLANFH